MHVIGLRDDGYHELQTAFQFVNYCDELQFEISHRSDVELLTPISSINNSDNLIIRAAKMLQEQSSVNQGVKISLTKYLPIGGGLGGGSSNAATTLVALNKLWQCQMSHLDLSKIGLKLGADVPVFIHGNASWAEGIGERLISISPPEHWYAIIIPNCHVPTNKIFSASELTRDCKPITIAELTSEKIGNVCEDVVRKRHTAVSEALDWLGQFGKSKMTGTGGGVFIDFNTQDKAQNIMDRLPNNWKGFIAKACNKSPLYA